MHAHMVQDSAFAAFKKSVEAVLAKVSRSKSSYTPGGQAGATSAFCVALCSAGLQGPFSATLMPALPTLARAFLSNHARISIYRLYILCTGLTQYSDMSTTEFASSVLVKFPQPPAGKRNSRCASAGRYQAYTMQ